MNNKGFALIITVLVTALLVTITAELIHQVYIDVSLSRAYRDGQQASIKAESAIEGAIRLIQGVLKNKSYTALTDAWAMPVTLEDETGILELSITEESGKINLNRLIQANGETEDQEEMKRVKRLGSQLQLPEAIWNSLADWLDKDDQPRGNGGETAYYRSLVLPYSARNGALETIQELTLIKEITPEMAMKLLPFVGINDSQVGPSSQININTAPKEVLMALDDRIDGTLATRIIDERRQQPFASKADVVKISGMETIGQSIYGSIIVKGTLFRIVAIGHVHETARRIEALVRITDNAADILFWREL